MGHYAKSPAEAPMGWQLNYIGDMVKSSSTSISEEDLNFQLELNELPRHAESTILVRERSRGSKLEPAFRRQRGRILSESN